MKTNKFILALMGATLLSANALASGVVYDENGFSTDVSQPYQAPSANTDGAFEIANAGNLYWFAEYVSQGGDNAKANAVLTKDIVVNENVLDKDGNLNADNFKKWNSIGSDKDPFAGTFDGNGHKISGLYLSVGLFGRTAKEATIKNVGVVDSYFKGNKVGGVCGYNWGAIINCYNTGVVDGEEGDVGGVCGINKGAIANCYNTGAVSADMCDGGVCGTNSGTIINCYNLGVVSGGIAVGGVCGNNDYGTIKNCYSAGDVRGDDDGMWFAGVCGLNQGPITTCYYLNSSADQGVGEGNAEGVTSASTDEFADGTIAQFLRDYDNDKEDAEKIGSDVWGQYVDVDGVPTFRGYVKFNPTQITEGDYTGYYALANADDLYWFANFVNQGGDNVFAKAILTKDIVVNENVLDNEGNLNGTPARIWTPIGTTEFPYSGNFDGNGHTVSGLYFNDDTSNGKYVGLFGNVYGTWESGELIKKAVIKNVGIVDSYINAHDCIGGICGQAYNVEIINCYNTCNLYGHGNIYSGFDDLGGICGKAQNVNIVNCYNMGKTIGSSYHVGGICGSAYDNVNIINCYNIDKVFSDRGYVGGILGYGSNSAIINCYNIGSIEDPNNYSHGGICGDESDNITNCYYLASSEKTDGARTSTQFADGTVATALHNYDNGETGDANINGAIWGQGFSDLSPDFSGEVVTSIAVDETNFPDANFRQFVLDEIDADEDGALNKAEVEATVEISCGGKEIESLKGIEYFTALKSLACGNNKITELDLSANTAVTTFVLSNNVLDKGIVESTGFVMPNVVFENVSNVTGATIEKDETTGGTKFIPSSALITEISYTYDVTNSNVENPTFKVAFSQIQVVAYDVDGDGTIGANEQAYAISTDDELYWFANFVNQGGDNVFANVILTKDIVINENVLDNKGGLNGTPARTWTPIGTEDFSYSGVFDGNGHTISGLYADDEEADYVGLFGKMYDLSSVKKLGVVDSYFKGNRYVGGICGFAYDAKFDSCYNAGVLKGHEYVGGLFGEVSCDFDNYDGDKNMNNMYVTNCHNEGSVEGDGRYIGGIAGQIGSRMENCYNVGTVVGTEEVGGIGGFIYLNGLVKECYNIGEIKGESRVGGLTGGMLPHTSIINCYNSGKVECVSVGAGLCCINEGLIVNSYANGAVTSEGGASGICVENNGTIVNCYYDNTKFTDNAILADNGTSTVYGNTSAQFADGTVASALHDYDNGGTGDAIINGAIWGQTVGQDGCPNFSKIILLASIDETNFPDANFRQYVLDEIDADEDGTLSKEEIEATVEISCSGKEIESLKGIEYFTALESLECGNNKITELDLSANTAVATLVLSNNVLDKEIVESTGFVMPNVVFENVSNVTGATIEKDETTGGTKFIPSSALITEISYTYDVANSNVENPTFKMAISVFESIAINETNFPDENFRQYILDVIDTNDDEILNLSEFVATKQIDCSNRGIASLQGIEYFTGITELICNDNKLTSVDLSHNTALQSFNCYFNKITSLDVSANTELTKLVCDYNSLSSLDLSKNTNLEYLECSANKIESLDLSNNANLLYFSSYGNRLKSLDLSKNAKLNHLSCDYNQLASLTVSPEADYSYYSCAGNINEALGFDAEGGIVMPNVVFEKVLSCSENVVATKDEATGGTRFTVVDNTTDEFTYTYDMENSSIAPEDYPIFTIVLPVDDALYVAIDETIFPDPNFRQEITSGKDLNGDGKLSPYEIKMATELVLENKNISSIQGVDLFTNLFYLNCSDNNLTSVDLSNNTKLNSILVDNNQLESIDVSHNTALVELSVEGNHLTSIDLSQNLDLSSLNLSNNHLTDLDLSHNEYLFGIQCEGNTFDMGVISMDGFVMPNVDVLNVWATAGANPDEDITTGGTLFMPWMENSTSVSYQYYTGNDGVDPVIFTISFVVGKKLELSVNDESFGEVVGSGVFVMDSTVEISATPNAGYHFVNWSNGSTKIKDSIHVVSDTALVATFEAHLFGNWDTTLVATCAVAGLRTRACACGEVETDTIAKLAHTIVVDSAKTATCTATGLTEGSHCSVCNSILVAQQIVAKIAHTVVVDSAKTATCSATGLTEGSHCSVCNEVIKAQDAIPALGHKVVVDSAVVATCTATGLTEGKHCSVCDSVLVAQQTIPALDHSFTNYIYNNDATTEADGTETAVCDHGCGATDTRTAEGTKLTDIDATETAEVFIYAHHNVIVVENADADIYVYDATGRCVAKHKTEGNRTEITVQKQGLYIVKVGAIATRVVVE